MAFNSGIFLFALALFASPGLAQAGCNDVKSALRTLELPGKDPDLRSYAGACLVRYHLDRSDVARLTLRIIRDPQEDILLREDLIEAFADSPLRKKVRIESKLSPELALQDKVAIDRTVSGASNILAVAQAMKSIENTEPTTSLENEFFRALNEIAMDLNSHVLLRACALNALEKLSVRVVNSGIYDEKSIRITRETLRAVSLRDDPSSLALDAGEAYSRLANAGVPGYTRELAPSAPTRMISSMKPAAEK